MFLGLAYFFYELNLSAWLYIRTNCSWVSFFFHSKVSEWDCFFALTIWNLVGNKHICLYICCLRYIHCLMDSPKCTSWSLFPLAEYMPKGSLYDYLHKNHNVLKLSQLLRFAVDVCRGMEYLHQNNIIHRDLKTANLLMDTNNVRDF